MSEKVRLSNEQVRQLLKDNEIVKKIDSWKEKRWEIHKKWAEWVNVNALDKLSDDDLRERFIEYYKEGAGRHPFNLIYRNRIIKDVKKFREMLKFLLDEGINVKERIDGTTEGNGIYRIEGVGKALATSLLFDFNPEKYCIWNNRVNVALGRIGWLPEKKGKSKGERYLQIIKIIEELRSLAPKGYNNFNDVDNFLHIIAAEPEGQRALGRVLKAEVEETERFEIMEKTLSDFLQKNFNKYFPGFKIYEDEEGNSGIEYPTVPGKIDILAIDNDEKELLVIELKIGVASHNALSQVLSYIQWVEESIADDKKVRGMIIAEDMDKKLEYAIKRVNDVEFRRYRIDFKLD